MAEDSSAENETENSPVTETGMLSLLSIGRHSLGRDLRLKSNDVIVAIDGERFSYDVDRFDAFMRSFNELPALLTIFRDGKFFEVFVEGPLGCSYKYVDEATATQVNTAMAEHKIQPKHEYHQFEAMRNIRREIRLYDTSYSPLATIAPVFWLLYHRVWEPLGVVFVTYAICLFIQPALFLLVYFLISIYFHKAQTHLIRSHCLYSEFYFWMIFAAPSTKQAQIILRRFDPKCNFRFSHVGPPEKLSQSSDSDIADIPT